MLYRLVFSVMLSSIASTGLFGQKLPDKVRGYKSYNIPVAVRAADAKPGDTGTPMVRILPPQIDSVGLNGVTLTALAEINSPGQTGRVDFLTFRDFRVNGVRVEIEEYAHAFSFTDRGTIVFPSPFKILVPSTSLAKAAFKELIGSKTKWAISGTVLVFGRFKKYGFSFKRVVAVPIEIEIDNPVADAGSV